MAQPKLTPIRRISAGRSDRHNTNPRVLLTTYYSHKLSQEAPAEERFGQRPHGLVEGRDALRARQEVGRNLLVAVDVQKQVAARLVHAPQHVENLRAQGTRPYPPQMQNILAAISLP